MEILHETLSTGARLVGYLREPAAEMPAFATRPAMLIFPGGGYGYCSKREADPVAMQFLQAGYQTFILYYHCADENTAPLQYKPLLDAAAAILYLRRNADTLHLDPEKIAVCGFSAGGHLAASSAVLAHTPAVQKALGITGEEACPNAVVLGYPVITTGALGHQGSTENLCGTNAALRAEMSLENQIQPGLPPFFVWHTVTDESVPVQNSLLLANALEECDVPYELHLFAKGQHGMSTCTNEVNTPSAENSAWVPLCTRWLANVLNFRL